MTPIFKQHLAQHITLSDDDAVFAFACLKPRKAKRRQIVLGPGDRSMYQYFITRGLTRAYETDARGKEHTIQFGTEGTWTGDMRSYLTGEPSRLTIEAVEDSEFLLLSGEKYDSLLSRNVAFEKLFRILFQNAYSGAIERISTMLNLSALDRYSTFLQWYPQLSRRLDKRLIASFVGVTPEALSRMQKQLTKVKPTS